MSVRSQKSQISELPLEKKIKELLEQIISELEIFVKTNEEANKIEQMLHDYDSLSDLVEITIEIFKYYVEKVQKKMTKLKTYKFLVTSQNEKNDVQNLKGVEYNKLESQVQKYEAEIRNHIKIEQQLKLYNDSIQEKLDEREIIEKQYLQQNQILGEAMALLTTEKNEFKESLQSKLKENEQLQQQLLKLQENNYIILGGQNSIEINNKENMVAQNFKQYKKLTNKTSISQNQQQDFNIILNSNQSNKQNNYTNLNIMYSLLKKQNSDDVCKKEPKISLSQRQKKTKKNEEQQKFVHLISSWSKNSKQFPKKLKQYSSQTNQTMRGSKYQSVRSNSNTELINAFVKQKLDETQQVTKSFCSGGKKHNSTQKLKQQINQQYSTHRRSNSFAYTNVNKQLIVQNKLTNQMIQNYKFNN